MVTDVGHAQRVIRRTRDAEASGGVFTEIGLVTWRRLVKLTRTPVLLFFSLFMPLIWLVMFSQTFGTVFSSAASGGLSGGPLPYDYVAGLLPGLTLLAAAFGVAFSGLSNTVALRTKNTESTMMVSFSLTFPLLFLSTAMLPKALLPAWVQTFSTVNPVSYMADAARALILTGFDWTAIGNAFIAIAAFGIVLNGLAIMAFRAQGK